MKCMFTFIIVSFVAIISQGNESKRLLLNDPTIFQDRLNRLESLVSALNSTVKQQTQTIQYLTSTNQQQAVTIQQHASTIQQHATTNQQQAVTNKVMEAEISKLKTSTGTGSTYVIWGRKHCPTKNGTEQVYSGYAGGGYYTHSGSAAEYICLPPDPNFTMMNIVGTGYGYVYGAEYEEGPFGSGTIDQDVPCAVCRNMQTSSTLMIPGKNICYSGWTSEYHGYLASGKYDHAAASSYACVDIHPENLNAGAADDNGKLFYGVLAKCGSLQCPPYINNHPLTCVVCSK